METELISAIPAREPRDTDAAEGGGCSESCVCSPKHQGR